MPEISLSVFEGPLDLLLRLIEHDDLDVTAVSLVAVADQYLGAIRNGDSFEPQALAEFIAIGAKLIYLKSRALLPRSPEEASSLEDDEVGRELVDMLLEYRRFAQVADMLQERQAAGLRVFPRLAPLPPQAPGPGLDDVTSEALLQIMLEMLSRTPPTPPQAVITRTTMTITRKIADFRERLLRNGGFSFRQAIRECQTRLEVVVSFMAVLELLKAGECDARQSERFGDIEVIGLAVAAG